MQLCRITSGTLLRGRGTLEAQGLHLGLCGRQALQVYSRRFWGTSQEVEEHRHPGARGHEQLWDWLSGVASGVEIESFATNTHMNGRSTSGSASLSSKDGARQPGKPNPLRRLTAS